MSGGPLMPNCHEGIVLPTICLRHWKEKKKRALAWVMATATHQLVSLLSAANARLQLTAHVTASWILNEECFPEGISGMCKHFPSLSCTNIHTCTNSNFQHRLEHQWQVGQISLQILQGENLCIKHYWADIKWMSITQTCRSKHDRKNMHTNKSTTATEIDWTALTENASLPKCMTAGW